MSNLPQFAVAFKREVARVVRRELRRELAAVTAAVRKQRTALKALRLKCAALEKRAGQAPKPGAAAAKVDPSALNKARFSPGLITKLRKRHGLSRQKFAKLLGVTSLSVKFWEHGQGRPRSENQLRLLAMRRHSTASLKKLLAAKKTVMEA